eukprot:CAMPEP_0170847716 /NCGR_PEP_ID=MMETSP0734-20130129/8941_1 /TAXON_ID=186038 /ORGANISM="Fragilariopsis kerguelensis, Strain L26-C5" /LENGTH=105 /DNA_ID=CAMNT_0011216973 /DNA_START=230 /DNA_END=547 /DNA_ORIENTATION=+
MSTEVPSHYLLVYRQYHQSVSIGCGYYGTYAIFPLTDVSENLPLSVVVVVVLLAATDYDDDDDHNENDDNNDNDNDDDCANNNNTSSMRGIPFLMIPAVCATVLQ